MPKPEMDTRFSKFGTVSFTAVTKVNDFIGYLEEGKVAGTQCTKCGQKFFPPRSDCFACPGEPVEWFEVQGTGKLMTFSELMYAPIGFGEDLPYAIAVLDYGDFKVFGRIGEVPFEEVKIGMEMVTKVNQLPNGNLNYVFEKA
ncbi:Zn-ribbon domain-containing OB-fold protein [Desulfoferula mesophila]|uniref:DNA-binding protein n=1 Tax=Desulfoferula mesophila TaxID=3058419 RepID=A0AAU9ECB6_9BACT|nr:hypothetical protein FAK_17890 [Desulfoferula mesophilus]